MISQSCKSPNQRNHSSDEERLELRFGGCLGAPSWGRGRGEVVQFADVVSHVEVAFHIFQGLLNHSFGAGNRIGYAQYGRGPGRGSQ